MWSSGQQLFWTLHKCQQIYLPQCLQQLELLGGQHIFWSKNALAELLDHQPAM
jgi:hypothetical protein